MADISNNNRSIELCRRVVTTESFIAEAKEIYGETYDYSKVNYINSEHQVVVVCSKHGDFNVYAREHLDGRICPKCERESKFISKLNEKFGDKFDTSKVVYKDSQTPVEVICPEHGSFYRTTNQILQSRLGCPKCAEKLRDEAHQLAEERKADEKAAKNKADEEVRDAQMQEYSHHCERLTRVINVSQNPSTKLYYYYELINERINFIQNRTKWIKRFQDKYTVSPDLLVERGLYQEGDTIYCFPGEAPDGIIVNEFNRSQTGKRQKFNRYLSKRNCALFFQGNDLYILYKPGWFQEYNDTECTKRKTNKCSSEICLPSNFISIDFETLFSQRVSACSIGMVKYKDGAIVDRYYSLIRPPHDYPGKCGVALSWIHGFTEDMLQDERTFADIHHEIENFIEGFPLVAHNACVEKACFKETISFYGLTSSIDYENIFDTLYISKQVEKSLGIYEEGPGTHTLDAVCRRFGVDEMHHHNALDDAEMCGNLMIKFIKCLNENVNVFATNESNEAQLKKKHHQKYNEEDKVQRTDMENVVENPFKDCGIVLTGFSTNMSQEYGHKLKELGAKICSNVSGKTKWLICGANAGPSKMQKAEQIGAKIINEQEFLEIINNL